jgi:hypothetical protein
VHVALGIGLSALPDVVDDVDVPDVLHHPAVVGRGVELDVAGCDDGLRRSRVAEADGVELGQPLPEDPFPRPQSRRCDFIVPLR